MEGPLCSQGKEEGVSHEYSLVCVDRPCCEHEPYFQLGWCDTPSKRTRLEEERVKESIFIKKVGTCTSTVIGVPPSSEVFSSCYAAIPSLVAIHRSDKGFSWI